MASSVCHAICLGVLCLFATDKEGELPALRERLKEIGIVLHKLLATTDSKVCISCLYHSPTTSVYALYLFHSCATSEWLKQRSSATGPSWPS